MNAYPSRVIGEHVVHYVGKVCNHVVDHAVPAERNDFYPHALKHRVLLGYSLILILVKALAIVIPIALPAAYLYSSAITETNVLTLTNAARATAGLSTLAGNALLAQAAQAKAGDMLANQYFAHQSPDGRMPWNFIRSTGYAYQHAGENLAVHFQQAEDVHGGWMASPSHRANILDDRYTQIGVGIASGNFEGVPTVFVVQMFGTPMTAATAPTPAAAPTPAPVTAPVQAALPEPEPEPTPAPKPTPAPTPAPVPQPAPVIIPKPAPVIVPVPTPEPVVIPEPIIVATPAPTPAPVIPVVPVVPVIPVINTDSASITPIPTGYRVRIAVKNAHHVNIALGASTAALQQDPAGTNQWYGVITSDASTSQGSTLTAIATGTKGDTVSAVLATLTPAAQPQDLFLFNSDERTVPKVFGILDVGHFNDTAKRFYAYASIFMAGLLLAALAFRFHKHHPTALAHATGVLGLAILLGLT